MNKKRFEVIYSQGSFLGKIQILRDRETGVAYMNISEGYGGGLCPLLNADGSPMVYTDNSGEFYLNNKLKEEK